MSAAVERRFASRLAVAPDTLWDSVTSADGINAELMPLMSMRSIAGIEHLSQLVGDGGIAPFDVKLRLAGLIPFGSARIVIVELGARRFVERSDQPGMAFWEHERSVTGEAGGSVLADRLRFTPKVLPRLAPLVIESIFRHRHRRLRAMWGT